MAFSSINSVNSKLGPCLFICLVCTFLSFKTLIDSDLHKLDVLTSTLTVVADANDTKEEPDESHQSKT